MRKAAAGGARIIVLPEALPFGWMDPGARTAAEEIPSGRFCTALRAAAKELGVFICSGVIERSGSNLFNAAILVSSAGDILLHHRKIHELDIAQNLYARGDRLGVADTAYGRIGLMICADAFAPAQAISRTLGLMGAQLILSPCAWAVPPGHDHSRTPYGQLWMDNYAPVARDFGLWVAGCSNVGPIVSGPWAGHQCIGCSMVVGPDGQQVVSGTYGEAAEEICSWEIPRFPG